MKSSTLSLTLTLVAAMAQAAPTATQSFPDEFKVGLTFYGAAGASYDMSAPTDDTAYPITNPLSVSSISSGGGGNCNFFGGEGGEGFLPNAGTVEISPPQTQVSVICDVA
ncbi:hypothetical protein MMC34_001804 [Xylographa carneopallida]|nr:hypothetical protein [Xylographa carneopallida]